MEEPSDNNIDIRPEEKWHESLDNLARKYRDHAATQSELQDRAAYGARMKHIIFGLPGPLISLSVAMISSLWTLEQNVYVIAPLSLVGGTATMIHNFFDLGGKAQQHWDYASRYGGVCSKIDAALARDPDFRTPPDASFAEWRTELDHLGATAPVLPGKGCCGCSKYDGKKALPAPTQEGETFYRTTIV